MIYEGSEWVHCKMREVVWCLCSTQDRLRSTPKQLQRMSRSHKLSLFKLEFDFFAAVSRHHLFDKNITDRCPCCLHTSETFDHVLHCPHIREETLQKWEALQEKLCSPWSCTPATKKVLSGHYCLAQRYISQSMCWSRAISAIIFSIYTLSHTSLFSRPDYNQNKSSKLKQKS